MDRRQILFLALALLLMTLAAAGVVLASSENGISASWFRFGPGGVSYCTDGYSLASAIGEPAAGEMTGGSYSLVSGIEMEAAECRSISLPVVLK